MNRSVVSAVAVLFCCAIIAIVGLFGWSRYKAAQAADAQYSEQLRNPSDTVPSALNARMPAQLPARSTSAAAPAAPSPQPSGL